MITLYFKRSRRFEREKVLQVLYAIDVGRITDGDVLLETLLRGDYEHLELELPIDIISDYPEEDNDYPSNLIKGITEKCSYLDEVIQTYSINWPINRISRVDYNILRLAIYELLFMEDIPFSVTANEAVELAKTFGNEKSSKFINGILGKVINDIEKGLLKV